MGKPRDAAKERYWRSVIRRQVRSGLGTRQFCARARISEHRFHRWRRVLRDRDDWQARAAQASHATATAQAGGEEADESAFVPVRLPWSLGVPLEVVHPRGYVVRVPPVFDATVLRRVLVVLDRPDDS